MATGPRITTLCLESEPDTFGRVHFTLFWVQHVPDGELPVEADDSYYNRPRAQVFFTNPAPHIAQATLEGAKIVTFGKPEPERPWLPVHDYTLADRKAYWKSQHSKARAAS